MTGTIDMEEGMEKGVEAVEGVYDQGLDGMQLYSTRVMGNWVHAWRWSIS